MAEKPANAYIPNSDLPVVSPESVGVPAKAVREYLDWLEEKKLCMHSMIMLRHGKVFSECYWAPFNAERKHRLYSTSKSFVSAAIGILIGEGKLSLDDHVADFFRDKWPEELPAQTADATVRDLLRMSTMQDGTSYTWTDMDWAETFFHVKANHYPGQIFRYDTSATTTLDILVQRLTGLEFTAFLRDRLFIPAKMSPDIWCVETPCGHEWGGSGVQATLRDMAKFGLICMNGGRWEGRQLIPEDYIRAATSYQIDNRIAGQCMEDEQGYGYQFWRLPQNGFACEGMGSQLIYCWPDEDFIFACQADTQQMSGAYEHIDDGLFDFIMPWLKTGDTLPEDAPADAALLERAAGLKLQCAEGEAFSETAARVSGKTYVMYGENKIGITDMRFTFEGDTGTLEFTRKGVKHSVPFGMKHNVESRFLEKDFSGKRIRVPKAQGYECRTSAGWVADDALLLYCWITDWYFGSLRMQATFEGESITIMMTKTGEDFLNGYVGFASGYTAGNAPEGGSIHE